MFENLLHQDEIVSRLRHDVMASALPPSLLFSGPPSTGKLTAALELARVLSCEKNGEWTCDCAHCRSHRALDHPRTILTGHRDLGSEIAAAAEALRRDDGVGSRYLMVRSVRKLVRRFDPFLWEGEEKKLTKIRPLMESLAETLEDLLPKTHGASEKPKEKILDGLVDACGDLQKALPGLLPVAQVRRMTTWALHSSAGDHKTIILDGADRMPDGSRNALLKFLEEPPPDTTVILVTDRKALLLPTITSRLRDYAFRSRRPTEQKDVLRRVFKEDTDRWTSLEEFFRAWRTGPADRMRALAATFLDHARSGRPDIPEEVMALGDPMDFIAFLEALGEELHRRWRENPKPDHRRDREEASALRDARLRTENLNIPIPMVIRGLFAAMEARSS